MHHRRGSCPTQFAYGFPRLREALGLCKREKKWSRRPKRKEIIQTGSINPGLYNSRKRWVLRVPSSWKVMQRVYNSFMYILTYFSLFNQVCCYSVQRLSSYFQGVGHKIILTAFFWAVGLANDEPCTWPRLVHLVPYTVYHVHYGRSHKCFTQLTNTVDHDYNPVL